MLALSATRYDGVLHARGPVLSQPEDVIGVRAPRFGLDHCANSRAVLNVGTALFLRTIRIEASKLWVVNLATSRQMRSGSPHLRQCVGILAGAGRKAYANIVPVRGGVCSRALSV